MSPNLDLGALDRGFEQVHRWAPDEAGDEDVPGVMVELMRRGDLLEHAAAQHGDAVAHRHRFDLIVGHVDRGHSELALQGADLRAHLDPQLRVEVRERLVHQEHRGAAHNRASHRDPLPLAAGERTGLAVQECLEFEQPRDLADPLVDLLSWDAVLLESERHVLEDVHVRIEGVVLEDHGDVPLRGGDVVDDSSADLDRSVRDRFEAGGHSQCGCLAAAGRADEHNEFTVADRQIQLVDGTDAAREVFRYTTEIDARHLSPLPRKVIIPSSRLR